MNIRQGDIIFSRVEDKAEGKKHSQLVIAEGEVTGHNHMLVSEGKTEIVGDRTKFTLTGKAKLTHPEHDTLSFPKGTYIVTNEREWNYLENELEKVRD